MKMSYEPCCNMLSIRWTISAYKTHREYALLKGRNVSEKSLTVKIGNVADIYATLQDKYRNEIGMKTLCSWTNMGMVDLKKNQVHDC